jgi:predicted CopG family antitoxin
MAKKPKRLDSEVSEVTTAKLKIKLYNKIVRLRRAGESISDAIERLISRKEKEEHKTCSQNDEESL